VAITRAQVETILLARCGNTLVACDLSAQPQQDSSPRQYCSEPIAEGLRFLGVAPADSTAPADADLAGVPDADLPALLDVAELRLMECCAGAFVQVTWSRGNDKQALSDFAGRLDARIARKAEDARRKHGYGASAPAVANLDLGFAATGCGPPPCAEDA
jgi:hypothetical protein